MYIKFNRDFDSVNVKFVKTDTIIGYFDHIYTIALFEVALHSDIISLGRLYVIENIIMDLEKVGIYE